MFIKYCWGDKIKKDEIGGLQWHTVHTKFSENQSSDSKVERGWTH